MVSEFSSKNVEELNIEIKTGVNAQPQQVKSNDNPYAVIVSIGAKPIVPSIIPGVNNENVFNAIEVLNNPILIQDKSRVSIVGGGMTGCELAELLSNKNCMVTIIEMQSELATNENEITRTAMLKRLEDNKNIQILTCHKLESIKEDTVELENLETGEKNSLVQIIPFFHWAFHLLLMRSTMERDV